MREPRGYMDEEGNKPPESIPLYTEFDRNAQMTELKYDRAKIASRRVVVVGNNALSENIIKQLLVLGFQDIYLWSHEKDPDGDGTAVETLRNLSHVSPFYRNKRGYQSLEARAITSSFDSLGFSMLRELDPGVVINTQNNAFLSDILASRGLSGRDPLYIDAHSVMDHRQRLYGFNIQAASVNDILAFDMHDYIESRDLSLFEGKKHDPFLSMLCASYVSSYVLRHTLDINAMGEYFQKPTSFTFFPFAADHTQPGPAQKEVHYRGFFKGKGIYVAGLGGGILAVDTLLRIFDVNRLWGVDKDRLERTNYNRLVPLIDECLIGKMKADAASIVYQGYATGSGRKIRFIDGLIFDSLLIGDGEQSIDVMLGCLSGFDNKINLIALSQKLSEKKPHILVDVGNEPFRFDVVNYVAGITPCDHCRNMHDLAVVEHIANNVPNCDRYPTGSTVFANYLCLMGIIEAMKYIDPNLGAITTGSVSGDLLPHVRNPSLLLSHKASAQVYPELCKAHRTTSPLTVRVGDYIIEDGFSQGWNMKEIYEKADGGRGRLVGKLRHDISRQKVADR